MMTHRRVRLALFLGMLVWLAGVIPAWSARRGGVPDFSQYYMGGVIAQQRAFDALYPVPTPGAPGNPGFAVFSSMRPEYERLAMERGVGNEHRFIHPPTVALAFVPLAWMDYPTARWAWQSVMAAMCCVILFGMARSADGLIGKMDWRATALMGVIGFSPLMYWAVRTANITPAVALMVGLAAWGMMRRKPVASGLGIVLGAMGKGASAGLVPSALARRHYADLLCAAAIGLLLVGLSLIVTGLEPWRVFITEIAPVLSRHGGWNNGNQSLYGIVLRLTNQAVLTPSQTLGIRLAGVATGMMLLITIWKKRAAIRQSDPAFLLAAIAVIQCMLLFSPINWPHYLIYMMPLWGALVWLTHTSRAMAVVVAIIVAMLWCPISIVRSGALPLPEVVRSHLVIAQALILATAWWSVARYRVTAGRETGHAMGISG